jgi:hypothetical protein
MKRGYVPTQSWSGKSAVFLMESALTSHGSSKSNKKPSDGRGISDYDYSVINNCTSQNILIHLRSGKSTRKDINFIYYDYIKLTISLCVEGAWMD